MTNKEKLLVSKLLERAGDEFSNHGCNDVDDEWFIDWSKEEMKALDKKVTDELCGEGEYEDCEPYMNDDGLMAYFSEVLKKEANKIASPPLGDSG